MNQPKFPCTACGACCRRINIGISNWEPYSRDPESLFYFPYKWDENGVCENLAEDNRCRIYENRPFVCNTEKMVEVYIASKYMTREEYFEMCASLCNSFMEQDGISDQYKIIIKPEKMKTAAEKYIDLLNKYKKDGEYTVDSAIDIAETFLVPLERQQAIDFVTWVLSKREIIQTAGQLFDNYLKEKKDIL